METYQLTTGVGALCIQSMVCVNNKPVCITPQLFINHHLPSTSLPFFHGMAIVVTHISPGDINDIIIISMISYLIINHHQSFFPMISRMIEKKVDDLRIIRFPQRSPSNGHGKKPRPWISFSSCEIKVCKPRSLG